MAKLDFKRGPGGELFLLEINAKFTLWHYPGAVAGVNIPAIVYADLTGAPRPPKEAVRSGVSWCKPWADYPAVRESGTAVGPWLWWMLRCETKRDLAWFDPGPAIGAGLFALRRVAGNPTSNGARPRCGVIQRHRSQPRS